MRRVRQRWPRLSATLLGLLLVAGVLAGTVSGAGPAGALAAASRSSKTTPPPLTNMLNGVSCYGRVDEACMAVGYYETAAGAARTLAEQLAGDRSRFALSNSPDPGPGDNQLDGVSCLSGTFCMAVGTSGDPGSATTLAEQWNGKRWTIVTTPDPGTGGDQLNGVTCLSTTDCVAVGGTASGLTLVESWDGTSWSVSPSPTPEAGGLLNSVSCSGASSCAAVGAQSTSPAATLGEEWNGTAWSIVTTPTEATYPSSLTSVSCPSSTYCVAVGDYFIYGDSEDYGALSDTWNGTTWTAPPGGGYGINAGVSCASTTSCGVVGTFIYGAPFANQTSAGTWNGGTSYDPTPPSPGTEDNGLNAVSCLEVAAKFTCTAVGYSQNSGEPQQTLVEAPTATNPDQWRVVDSADKVGAAAPTITELTPSSGAPGTKVTIRGTALAGATAVSFNGTAAVIVKKTAKAVTTKVPAAATTGTVQVTTDGGTATSSQVFTVP